MQIFAVVWERNPNLLLGGEKALFVNPGDANRARDDWNRDIGFCETKVAIVKPMTIQQSY